MANTIEILRAALLGPQASAFGEAWGRSVHRSIAREAMRWIDFERVRLDAGWTQLDDPTYRLDLVTRDEATIETCAALLRSEYAALNAALKSENRGRLSNVNMENSLVALLPDAIADASFTQQAVAQNPFPTAWRVLSKELGGLVFDRAKASADSEWLLANRLLLATFFQACRLPTAATAAQAIDMLSRGVLSVRGSLVRMAARVTTAGIVDPLPVAASLGPTQALRGAPTDLLRTVSIEASATLAGSGVMHRILSAIGPMQIDGVLANYGVTTAHGQQYRDLRYREHEYVALTVMALGGIEQLLRGLAKRRGVQHLSDARPRPVTRWLPALGLPANLQTQIKALYDPDGPNIRNRALHGALLEIESKRLEITLSLQGAPSFMPIASTLNDPFSAESTAVQCLRCLEALDTEMTNQGGSLVETELKWVDTLALSPQELVFAASLPCEMLTSAEVGQAILRDLRLYINAVAPVSMQLFQVFFHGWVSASRSGYSVAQHALAALFFEILYRQTVALLGWPVLQQSLGAGDSEVRIQYQMLDELGLCRPEVLDALVRHLDITERPVARQALSTAVRARNALAHGAIVTLTKERHQYEGHLFIRCVQLLAEAGVHHMTEQAAYFRWRNAGAPPGSDFADWLFAEQDVWSLLERLRA